MSEYLHGSYAPWFEPCGLPIGVVLAFPIAVSTPLTPTQLGSPGLAALAQWTAMMGESETAFRQRITADLAESGPPGTTVYVYASPTAWLLLGYTGWNGPGS